MNYYEYGDDKIDVLDRVLSLISTREYDDALECIDNLNSKEFSDPLLLMSKAQCLLRLNEKEEAYGIYKQAIELCDEKLKVKKDPFVLNIKGNCNLILKDYIKAIECYDEALDIDDKNSLAISFKAVALFRLDEQDAAFDCLERLLEIDSNNNDIKLFKVQYLNTIEKYE